MYDLDFFKIRLRLLESWLCNKIDGVEVEPLEALYYKQQVTYEMNLINKPKKEKSSRIIFITDHAFDRAKERLSMDKDAFEKLAEKAFEIGFKHSSAAGRLRRYIDAKFLSKKTANNIRIYGENIFFFSKKTLLTVHQIPLKFRRAALNNQTKNNGK